MTEPFSQESLVIPQTTSDSEFARRMILMARPAERFVPSAVYDRDGDCIEFLVKPDPFYDERVDDLVTVYFSQETHEVIGSLVKGVSAFCRDVLKRFPGFRIIVDAGRVRLEHIFLARLWSGDDADPHETNDPHVSKTHRAFRRRRR